MAKVTINYNSSKIRDIDNAVNKAIFVAADRVLSDLKASGTMPFDVGTMQNNATFVEKGKNKASIITATSYGRRLYFHPEYDFQKTNNPKAGGLWFEPYVNGAKKNLFARTFAKVVKEEL